jgi:hypothetical protein
VTYILLGRRARLLAFAQAMNPRSSEHPPVAPVSIGLRIIESLTIVLLALMAFLLALK